MSSPSIAAVPAFVGLGVADRRIVRVARS